VNLNRHYEEPCPTLQPTIFAAKAVVAQAAGLDLLDAAAAAGGASGDGDGAAAGNAAVKGGASADASSATGEGVQRRLKLYVDLHAHANKRGCFMYGNHHNTVDMRVQGRLYPFLVEQHCELFEYSGCDFSISNMMQKDKRGQSKAGSGRVGVFKEHQDRGLSVTHAYTLECNYNMGTKNAKKYTPQDFRVLGRACLTALLELTSDCPQEGVGRDLAAAAAAAAAPPKAPIGIGEGKDDSGEGKNDGEGKNEGEGKSEGASEKEEKSEEKGEKEDAQQAEGGVTVAQCPCLPMLETKQGAKIHRGLDALESSHKIREKIVGRGKKGGGRKKSGKGGGLSLREKLALSKKQLKEKFAPPDETAVKVKVSAEARHAASAADVNCNEPKAPTSVELFVLEDAMAALQAQLDAGAGLSEAKRYALKKQLAVKKAAKGREERRLHQKQAQEQGAAGGSGGAGEKKVEPQADGMSEAKQADDTSLDDGSETKGLASKTVLGEATNTNSSTA
jgi:hypothetical protein